MDPRLAALKQHLNEVNRLAMELAGEAVNTSALAALPAYTPPVAPAPQGQALGSDCVMKFGKYSAKKGASHDHSLAEIAFMGDIRYLSWVADKYGLSEDGSEDPKYAVSNAKYRAVARQLLNGGTQAPAPAAAPAAYAPPAAPAYSPPADDLGDEIPF